MFRSPEVGMLGPAVEEVIIFEARHLPDGRQGLVPKSKRPRCCMRSDGVAKVRYDTRELAHRAKRKHQKIYRCSHCAAFHVATLKRHSKPLDPLGRTESLTLKGQQAA